MSGILRAFVGVVFPVSHGKSSCFSPGDRAGIRVMSPREFRATTNAAQGARIENYAGRGLGEDGIWAIKARALPGSREFIETFKRRLCRITFNARRGFCRIHNRACQPPGRRQICGAGRMVFPLVRVARAWYSPGIEEQECTGRLTWHRFSMRTKS